MKSKIVGFDPATPGGDKHILEFGDFWRDKEPPYRALLGREYTKEEWDNLYQGTWIPEPE